MRNFGDTPLTGGEFMRNIMSINRGTRGGDRPVVPRSGENTGYLILMAALLVFIGCFVPAASAQPPFRPLLEIRITGCLTTRFMLDFYNYQGDAKAFRLKAESQNQEKPEFIPLIKQAGRWQGEARLPFSDDWKLTVVTDANETPISTPLYRNTKKVLTDTLKQVTRMFPGIWRSEEQKKFLRNTLGCPDNVVVIFPEPDSAASLKIQIPAHLKDKLIHAVLLTDTLQFAWQYFGPASDKELLVPKQAWEADRKYQVIMVECR